ncbi:MAG: ribonuclease D [Desulfobacteraceae bacterium 4572_35.1]|nr:MAG: ribonuclease D [Desulfobacteraceae bacterium 4572_35.1]
MSLVPILTTTAEVEQLASALEQLDVFAVDMEADSMHSYQEKVCLIQFTYLEKNNGEIDTGSDNKKTVLLDPLAGCDLSALLPVMAQSNIRKIFHAADYDIRCLTRDFNMTINGLFDTMIASQLLGEERVGLADVLEKYFSVTLDKKYQRADWSKRPLSQPMCDYAAGDTFYLHELAQILEDKLIAKDRLWWAQEEFGLLEQARFQLKEGPMFLRFKGAGVLQPRSLAVLEALLLWRNREAERRDCPAYKVLGNKILLSLACTCPSAQDELKKVDDFAPRLIERYGKATLQIVAQSMQLPEDRLPHYPRSERPKRDVVVDKRFNKLKQWRKGKAEELGLDPGILINNTMLETIARLLPQSATQLTQLDGMKMWQSQVLGDEILQVLSIN